MTEEGLIAGTLSYLAPETLQGHPADARSDIWALGVVLYKMAAGTRPFHANGDDRDALFRRDPLLVSLRDHPRFQKIIDSIGFRHSSVHPRGT